ncbi:MAG: TatD family hydrolase [Patescibacteria group bacterium]|nr:TatD family hydrolase [Patescibacteria group bacterium]
MNVRYIDAHCHLQFEQYEKDGEELIEKMSQEGVTGIVVGCDLETSEKAVALAEKYEHLYASVGLHPNNAGHEIFDEEAYRALAMHPKVVAIGECGLDYFRPIEMNDEVKHTQKELLHKHITFAASLNKPLIIHCRPTKGTTDAYRDLIEILKEAKAVHPKLYGDIHFFVGDVEDAHALIALDFTLSFTAVITFARDYDEVIKAVPLASILSETDAPYLAPASRRGKRNDPLAAIEVVNKIAEIRGEDAELVREALLTNAKRVFAL